MASLPVFTFIIFHILTLSPYSHSHEASSAINTGGFSTTLIHRNSVKSPFYNPNLNYTEQVQESVRHSFSRYHHLQSQISKRNSPKDIEIWTWKDHGAYVITYALGTPTQITVASVDTASVVTWLQCLPCKSCFDQPKTLPIFDPSKSSSYDRMICQGDSVCLLAHGDKCDNGYCSYLVEFVDSTYTEGELAYENLVFRDSNYTKGTFTVERMIIGCGHQNTAVRDKDNKPGIIGLGKYYPSLISQLKDPRFSYCLVPKTDDTSRIRFGTDARIVGSLTPLLHSDKPFYYVNLEGISVNDFRLPIPPGTFNKTDKDEGGLIIDSGSTYTSLPKIVNKLLIDELLKTIDAVGDPFQRFELCFESQAYDVQETPAITFHFTGADLKLDPESTWVYRGLGAYCLGIFSAHESGISIFGNHQQRNLNVGYDLQERVVSFEHRDCINNDE